MNLEYVKHGSSVYHVAHPGRLGVLTGRTLNALFPMAEVHWGGNAEFVDVSKLVVFDPNTPRDPDTNVKKGVYGTIDDLRRRITFEKLRGLLTDVFYSMKASEIDFYPHQYKPVLRFIESPTNRLLIADEVGLGKTIESGLIWTEWQARQKARRLLVVCTPTLCPKWARELQDRFQLPAEYADAAKLVELMDRFDRQGPGLGFVAITTYHTLRPFQTERAQLDELRESGGAMDERNFRKLPPRVRLLWRLEEWSAAERFIDMVVFDEATAMKSTASASYVVGEVLSASASAALCLSATPIHNQSRDLYALLRLIDPEVFRDQFVFDRLREQNLPIIRLHNLLSQPTWSLKEARQLANELSDPEQLQKFSERLAAYTGTHREHVEMRYQVERMNLLGGFINRTRKRDIISNRVIRQPVTLPVSLAPQEASFYRSVLALVRTEVRRRGDRVTSFHLIHPALRMASCLPVIANEVRSGKWGGFEELSVLAEDLNFEFSPENLENAPVTTDLTRLAEFDFEGHDSKYAALLESMRLISSGRGLKSDAGEKIQVGAKEKVIIFAFFKATIAYLQRRLQDDGFRTMAITGDIHDKNERDQMFHQFAEDENRILLCSEVGAEGVDLQFCRIVVNYDLPWNPMRVEQRIGRVDRIGQRSPTVTIVNFHVRDTIDGSIFSHLYSKIGVFEHTIGALEGILGEEVAKLTAQIFREDLTPQQAAEQAEQTALAVLARAKQEQELEESTGALLAFQDILSENIGESQRLGRFIKPAELRLHAQDFLSARFVGTDACILAWDNPAPGCLELKLSFRAFTSFEDFCRINDYAWPDGFTRASRIATLVFDPAIHERLKRQYRQLTLVTHLHPFFRWITKENESATNDWHQVSAIRMASAELPPGDYFYLIYRMTLEGITRKDAFHYALKNLQGGETFIGTVAEGLINQALDRGESAFPGTVKDHTHALLDLRRELADELKLVQRTFRNDQTQKLSIRRQQVTSHFDRRIQAQQRRIETLESAPEPRRRGLAGFRQQLANLKEDRRKQLFDLEKRAAALKESFAEVACGLIELTPT
jgi:superfamily II DNA or RNA helicase